MARTVIAAPAAQSDHNPNGDSLQMNASEQHAPSGTSFSEDFLRRSMRMTALLVLVGSLFALIYSGTWQALALLSGGAWSLVNLNFLKAGVRAVITLERRDRLAIAGLALIKFPTLYLTGYFLLSFSKFDVGYLLMGFSVFFAVLVLKSLGRALLHLDDGGAAARKQSALN